MRAQLSVTHSAMSHFPKKDVESQVVPTLRSCGLYMGHDTALCPAIQYVLLHAVASLRTSIASSTSQFSQIERQATVRGE